MGALLFVLLFLFLLLIVSIFCENTKIGNRFICWLGKTLFKEDWSQEET